MVEENVDDLDLSWTNEYLRTLHGGLTYQKEPMNTMNVHIYYSNTQNKIIQRLKTNIHLTINDQYDSSSLLEEDLISLIQQYRILNHTKYKCDGIMKFHIDIDPTLIIDHVNDEDFQFHNKDCVEIYDIPRNIHVSPSLFIFHHINSIHILFRELILVNPTNKPVPSILRNKQGKYTKKRVRIAELPETRKTRKHL